MLAAKFHDDLFYNNAYYSKLGKHEVLLLHLRACKICYFTLSFMHLFWQADSR